MIELPPGASMTAAGARFRVWAPRARVVDVSLEAPTGPRDVPMEPLGDGWFQAEIAGVRAGQRYRYRLDGGEAFPDPASRSQPEGPHGPSVVVDPAAYRWGDAAWNGLDPERLAIYELHVGTFTPRGTFEAITEQLLELKALGITAVELMPVAEFPGRWNWGYDGVDLYAPSSVYGGPDGLRRLVDAAHQAGLGMILDVVYNHFGPDGNYLRQYAEAYFTDRHHTPWGDAINYDGPGSRNVRQLVIQNAVYWLREFHLDGLRLDATHAIQDDSPRHLLSELAEAVHAVPGWRRLVIAEDHRNLVELIDPPERGGMGLDGVWADDFHHALRTFLTHEHEGYYEDYAGRPVDLARATKDGFLYQGERSVHLNGPRGTPVTDEPGRAFEICTENHDQVGNRALGERLNHLIDRERYLVASALLLLSPLTPILFQGQEFAASTPFLFFTDHNPELGKLVREGRRNEFKRFSAFGGPEQRSKIPDPQDERTFQRSKLDFGEREQNARVYRAYRELLALRWNDPVLCVPDRLQTDVWAAGDSLLVLRRRRGNQERLVLLNFGDRPETPRMVLNGRPSRSAGSAGAQQWRVLWSTDEAAGEQLGIDDISIPPRSARVLEPL
ncbi:MAG: malto-oligosyltrehalose trehalohydrolase [Chloroflexi bacterium]|nr:malto-oligosyltrehalose trehalohydrolase [Chloroflexota bacterium]